MKKLILLILGGLSAASVAAQSVTKKVDVSHFSGIVASSVFDITLVRSNVCSVEISYEKPYEDAIIVRTRGGNLELGVDYEAVPGDRRRNRTMMPIRAKVTMPVLNLLHLSGASRLTNVASFSFDSETFEGRLSGATSVTGLKLTGKNIDFVCSGASKLQIEATVENATFGQSGATGLDLEFSGDRLRIGASGATHIEARVECERADLETSGAASMTVTGRADTLHAQASGASKIDAGGLETNGVDATGSGSCTVEVYAKKEFRGEATGSSRLIYAGDPKTVVTAIGKGCSLSKR